MATIDRRVTVLEMMLETLPGDLNVRFDHAKAERDELKAQISRLQADMSLVKRDISEIKAELKALPRVLAEMLKS